MQRFDYYRMRFVIVGFATAIMLGGSSTNADFTFGTPTNLGPMVNTSYGDAWSTPVNLGATINSPNNEMDPALSADGLQLYFCSQNRPGGYGAFDIFVATRASLSDDWGQPVNVGSPVNTSSSDYSPSISADGLALFFCSEQPGGYGSADLWVTRRPTTNDDWREPINLGHG